ncbi:MAG: flagellar protein FliT [Gammaproteobacteria bacterium]
MLVEISRRMQACAGTGDWETVNHLQEQSRQLAAELFAEVITTAEVQVVTAAVNEVLTINDRVTALCLEARDVCFGEMDKFQQSRRAVKEYAENSG